MQETIYHKTPVGILKIVGDAEALTGVYFASTDKNGLKDDDFDIYSPPALPLLIETIHQLDSYFTGERMQFSLPLRQEGTAFQQKVWNELMNIPTGQTISYLTLSKRLGDVKAIRAVGTANGRNNISIIVPCHRVIGSNGSLVGYGGDLWRKQWLLQHEARFSNGVRTLFDEE